jgi:hypothetical protein
MIPFAFRVHRIQTFPKARIIVSRYINYVSADSYMFCVLCFLVVGQCPFDPIGK